MSTLLRSLEAILRSILLAYAGRIVFVLDEIDSQQIMSIPRSHLLADSQNVFRAVQLQRIQSSNLYSFGWPEPSDLIKDKNVSPF